MELFIYSSRYSNFLFVGKFWGKDRLAFLDGDKYV